MRTTTILSVLLAAVSVSAQYASSTGTELWVTFMENLSLDFNGPPYFELVISSDVNTSGSVIVPATNFTVPFTVAAEHATVIELPTNIYYPQGDEDVFNFGLKVVADDPVSVYAFHHRAYFSEAAMALPTERLGTEYRVMSHADLDGNSPNEFVVLATQDGTEVEITPAALTIGFRPPDVPFTITLDEGQAFQLQAMGDLTGSTVRSIDPTKRIALFAGARQADVGCGAGADDHLYECIPATADWGKDHIVVPFKDRGGDVFRFLASEDATSVQIGLGAPFMLNTGAHRDTLLTAPVRITATAPIGVGQFNESQICNPQNGDASFLWNYPTSFRDDRLIWSSRSGSDLPTGSTPEHFVNVVVSGSAGPSPVTLDGTNVTSLFLPVPGSPGSFYAQLDISEGEHVLASAARVWATAYGFGDYNSYALPLGFEDVISSIDEGTLPAIATPATAWLTSSGDELPLSLRMRGELVITDAAGRTVARVATVAGAAWPVLPNGCYALTFTQLSSGARMAGRLVLVSR